MFKTTRGTTPSYTGNTTWIYDDSDVVENLKCWRKATVTRANNPTIKLDSEDVLDLNRWKYYQEVPIVEHTAVIANEEEDRELEADTDIPEDDSSIAPGSYLGGISTLSVE
ncbi:hypothetical protein CAAN1_12S04808 [[Candida] anglica]|uniref:Uncharacterized protein n=1 Tax=[Candida] anglica TaxID=148631 RepID=A0ABP0E6P2_9ASCO